MLARRRTEIAQLALGNARSLSVQAREAAARALERLLRLPVLASFAPSAIDVRLLAHVIEVVAARSAEEPGLQSEVATSAIARFTGETGFRAEDDRVLRAEMMRGRAELISVRDAIGWLLLAWQLQVHATDARLTRLSYVGRAPARAQTDA